jgi:hypothetical protein
MKRTRFLRPARWALAAACLSMTVEIAPAGFAEECAFRDMQVLMSIEERQSASTISAEKVSDAIFALMTTRMVCHEGRVVDALATYDSIADSIIPVLFGQSGGGSTGGVTSEGAAHFASELRIAPINGAFTRGCAARDLQVLILIKESERSSSASAEIRTDAMLKLLHARMVCHEGHVGDALATYDSISKSITPRL